MVICLLYLIFYSFNTVQQNGLDDSFSVTTNKNNESRQRVKKTVDKTVIIKDEDSPLTNSASKEQVVATMFYEKLNREWFQIDLLRWEAVRAHLLSSEFDNFADKILEVLGKDSFQILGDFYNKSESTQYKSMVLAVIGKSQSQEALDMLTNLLRNTESFEELNVSCHVIARYYSDNATARDILADYYDNLSLTNRNILHLYVESALGLLGKYAISILHNVALEQIKNYIESPYAIQIHYSDFIGQIVGKDIRNDILNLFNESPDPIIKQMCVNTLLANYGTDALDELQTILSHTNSKETKANILHLLWKLDDKEIPEKYSTYLEKETIRLLDTLKDTDTMISLLGGSRVLNHSYILANKFKSLLTSKLEEKYGSNAFSIRNLLTIYFVVTGIDNNFLTNYIEGLDGRNKLLALQRLGEGAKVVDEKLFSLLKDSLYEESLHPFQLRSLMLGLSKYRTDQNEPVRVISRRYFDTEQPNIKIAIIENSVHFGTTANSFLLNILENESKIPYRLAALGSLLNVKENRNNSNTLELLDYHGRKLIESIFIKGDANPSYTIYVLENSNGVRFYTKTIADYFSLFGKTSDLAILDQIQSQISLRSISKKFCNIASAEYTIDIGVDKAKQDIRLRATSYE